MPVPNQASIQMPENRGLRMVHALTGWVFLSVLIPVLIGIGIGVLSMAPPEFTVAKICFSLAACILLTKTAWWVAVDSAAVATRERLIVCIVVFALTGVLWATSIIWIRNREPSSTVSKQEPFSVEVRSSYVSDSGPLTLFMVGYPSMFGNTTSPVLYLAYIQVTNLQGVPTTMSDLKVAASKGPEGPWEDLVPIPLAATTLYVLGVATPHPKNLAAGHGTYRLATAMTKEDMALAAVVDASPKLASEMAKLIQPHDTIYGWIALDSLRHVALSPGQIYFRIKAQDAAGKTGIYVVELPRKQPGDPSMDVNCGVIAVSGVRADISGFHVKYYSDPFPTPAPKR